MSVDRGVYFVGTISLVTEHCCTCGVVFAMTQEMEKRRREDHESFYCPAGHGQHYTGPNEADRLRAEVERKQQMLEAEQARNLKTAQERDQVARAHHKMRVRVMNGVCPCCNRTFQNLLRHMQTEHAGEFNVRTLRQAFGMTQAAVAQEAGVDNSHVSNYERGKPVAAYAAKAIKGWVDKHALTDRSKA
ncbi:MAG: helix-turn-helix transcriptional regulator [Ramlibacter sp.]|nr:helix-turn-helix transcriptional regulator [Ramlibacter sp.]